MIRDGVNPADLLDYLRYPRFAVLGDGVQEPYHSELTRKLCVREAVPYRFHPGKRIYIV